MRGAGDREHAPLLAGHRTRGADREPREQRRRIAVLDGGADGARDPFPQDIERWRRRRQPFVERRLHHDRPPVDTTAQGLRRRVEAAWVARSDEMVDLHQETPPLADPGQRTRRATP